MHFRSRSKGAAAQEQIAVLQEQLQQSRLQVGSQSSIQKHVGRRRRIWQPRNRNGSAAAAYQIAAFNRDAYTRLAKPELYRSNRASSFNDGRSTGRGGCGFEAPVESSQAL